MGVIICGTPRTRVLPVAALLLVAVAASAGAQPADRGGYRSHFLGDGTNTKAGRFGAIYRVTNLRDSGPGSLRTALLASGPRFVLFEVSGTIALNSPLIVTSPFLTIAGQTAPTPGVTIRNHPTVIDTHDVVIQHLRLRLGDSKCLRDCAAGGDDVLYVRNNAYNVVLDHLSVSWGTHGGVSVNAWSGRQPYNIAMLDCIVSENLTKAQTPFGTGTLFMPSADGGATFARNLHAHNGNRNPWVSPGWHFAGYNNVAYNAGSVVGDQGTLGFFQLMGGYGYGGSYSAVWKNNIAIAGPNTHADGRAVKIDIRPAELEQHSLLYMEGNIGPYQSPTNQWSGVTYLESAYEGAVRTSVEPAWFVADAFVTLDTADVLSYVLANAGARPLDRDSIDARIVADVRNRTGRLIATPATVGGFVQLAEVHRPLAVPTDPNTVADAAGRTRLELWLESFARALEPSQPR